MKEMNDFLDSYKFSQLEDDEKNSNYRELLKAYKDSKAVINTMITLAKAYPHDTY